MSMIETGGTGVVAGTTFPTKGETVMFRLARQPSSVHVRTGSVIDNYDVLLRQLPMGTSVLSTLYGNRAALPAATVPWEKWLTDADELDLGEEVDLDDEPSGPNTHVAQQITYIQQVTGWSDARLAEAFPGGVSRETVNRWRNQPDKHLRPENAYRLGILHELAERMDEAGIDAKVWLEQNIQGDAETPRSLIRAGRLADVRQAVDAILAGLASPTERMTLTRVSRQPEDVLDGGLLDEAGEWDVSDEDPPPEP